MPDNYKKARELANSAPDEYLNKSNLLPNVVDVIKSGEKPLYIIKFPGNLTRDDSPDNDASIIHKAAEWNSNLLFITDYRILFVEKDDIGLRAEHLPYEDVEKFDISVGGWIKTSKINIEAKDCSINSKIHKDMTDNRANTIMEYVMSNERDSPQWVNTDVDDVENALPMWYQMWLDTDIVANYGIGLSDSSYRLYISPRRLRFEPKNSLMNQSEPINIESSDIQFDEIKMATERDFNKENKSRYLNVINPVLESDSQAKKSKMRTIRIPIANSNDYVLLSVQSQSGHNNLLNIISAIEPHVDYPATSSEQDEKNSHDASTGDPIEILKQRLAEGEITVDEFEERKSKIE